MKTVLVTGASGFIGGHIVQALRARNIVVRCLVRRSSRLNFLGLDPSQIAWGDLKGPDTLRNALPGIDAIIHCAGLTKARSRAEYFSVNAEGSWNLYSVCAQHKGQLAKIIHISSLAAFGPGIDEQPIAEESPRHPVSDYGESKLAGQLAAEQYMSELPVSIVIPPAVYGAGDEDFRVFFRWILRGFVPILGKSPHLLSLIYVKDLTEAILQILFDKRTVGKSYHINDGNSYTWMNVADAVGAAVKRKPVPIHLPLWTAGMLGMIGDFRTKLSGKPRLITSDKINEFLQTSWISSSRRIREDLGFLPQYSLESGMRETFDWYKANGRL
jgi:nucleoside-diphosphate-sugar epimerase